MFVRFVFVRFVFVRFVFVRFVFVRFVFVRFVFVRFVFARGNDESPSPRTPILTPLNAFVGMFFERRKRHNCVL